MSASASFIEELLRRVPDLSPIYEEHLADNDGLLPHVFMGDVTRFAIASADERPRQSSVSTLFGYLEEGLRSGSGEVKELIRASFVENLIGETAALMVLKPLMGQELKTEVERICGQ
jgi:hypothetical protein